MVPGPLVKDTPQRPAQPNTNSDLPPIACEGGNPQVEDRLRIIEWRSKHKLQQYYLHLPNATAQLSIKVPILTTARYINILAVCTNHPPAPEMARNEGNPCPNFQKFLGHRKKKTPKQNIMIKNNTKEQTWYSHHTKPPIRVQN